MFETFLQGLFLVLQWPSIGYLALGVIFGIWLGAVPGLGGIIGLVLFLPFTYGLQPVPAFCLLLGMFAVTTTSDTIASVLLGIPGTAASQATILDGHPLARQGQAERALGAAFTCSAIGGVVGAIILAASMPLVLPLILIFGSPEFFMLGLLGLAMVGSLSGRSIAKGLTVAGLGLFFATIGYAEVGAIPRYTLGADYLLDGLPLVPVVMGLFGIPEIAELAARNTSISQVARMETNAAGRLQGIKDAFRHWWLVLRCSVIGMYIGVLPGLGGAIVDWVAYGHAVQSARDKSRFGEGDIRGVIAPETANNALKGASLIPTVAFGIPGSSAMAILMGALLIQGLRPGPDMLTTNLDFTFSMVWMMVLANILVSAILLFACRYVAMAAFVEAHLIVPGVTVLILMGAWMGGREMGDWILALSMGALGIAMKRGGWPRPPLILGLVLGPIMENAFLISVRAHQGYDWVFRPPSLVIAALILLTVILAATNLVKLGARPQAPAATGNPANPNSVVSLIISVLVIGVFAYGLSQAAAWPYSAGLFPLWISIPFGAIALLILCRDAAAARHGYEAAGRTLKGLVLVPLGADEPRRTLAYIGWLAGACTVTLLVGQLVALPLFVALYLYVWGRYGWKIMAVYTGLIWAFLYGFYDRVLHIFWQPSLLF